MQDNLLLLMSFSQGLVQLRFAHYILKVTYDIMPESWGAFFEEQFEHSSRIRWN